MSAPPYRVSGSGPAVVLIHGTAPDFFDALEAELMRDHSVVRLDRRGFGKSGLSPVGALTPHVEDIAAIVDALGGATLVGWSMGGVIALEVALVRPTAVRGLVLLEPAWQFKRFPSLRQIAVVLGAKLRGALGDPGAGGERFLRWAIARRDGRCEYDDLSSDERARVHESARAMLCEFDASTGEHIASRLQRRLRAPVRLLVGTHSLPEFEKAARRLGKLLSIEPRFIDGAGHMLQQTHAAAVAESVRSITRLI